MGRLKIGVMLTLPGYYREPIRIQEKAREPARKKDKPAQSTVGKEVMVEVRQKGKGFVITGGIYGGWKRGERENFKKDKKRGFLKNEKLPERGQPFLLGGTDHIRSGKRKSKGVRSQWHGFYQGTGSRFSLGGSNSKTKDGKYFGPTRKGGDRRGSL